MSKVIRTALSTALFMSTFTMQAQVLDHQTLAKAQVNKGLVAATNLHNYLYVSGQNSHLYYSNDGGANWHSTLTQPNDHNAIDEVFATDTAVYVVTTSKFMFYSLDNGNTWNSSTFAPDYGKIRSIFVTPSNTIYIGTHLGNIFTSTNFGASWTPIPQSPSVGSPVNSIFVKGTALYVGSSDGHVYYSPNAMTWTAINGSPDGSAIRSVYVTNDNIYVNTNNEYAYKSTNLTGSGSWSLFAQLVYSMFVNANGSKIYIATKTGHVYSLGTTDEPTFVSYTPLNSVFLVG